MVTCGESGKDWQVQWCFQHVDHLELKQHTSTHPPINLFTNYTEYSEPLRARTT